ncbi:MAG: hypothetical protein Q9M94_03305 [Candidatus Gracilibacteria bacterium]|nr:hypothetical protein [Candidatus Gracilibacteria bacterium]
MNKILIFNILIFFVLISFGLNTSFASSGKIIEESKEQPKTIKELENDIEILKSKKVINFSILEKFKIEHGELQNYFSKDLISEEFLEIENIISTYKKDKENINLSGENKINKLLDLETKLYNSLLPSIDKDKITLYNIFVEKNLATIIKEDEIKSEIKDNKKEIETKVSTIKTKIEENNKIQEEKLNNVLKLKIKIKIIKFKNSEKIKLLTIEKQKGLFKLILKKINIKKEESFNLTKKTLKLYSIIEEVLIEIIEEL